MTLAADHPDRLGSATVPSVTTALESACHHLLGLQDAAGCWKGELETNVTSGAQFR